MEDNMIPPFLLLLLLVVLQFQTLYLKLNYMFLNNNIHPQLIKMYVSLHNYLKYPSRPSSGVCMSNFTNTYVLMAQCALVCSNVGEQCSYMQTTTT